MENIDQIETYGNNSTEASNVLVCYKLHDEILQKAKEIKMKPMEYAQMIVLSQFYLQTQLLIVQEWNDEIVLLLTCQNVGEAVNIRERMRNLKQKVFKLIEYQKNNNNNNSNLDKGYDLDITSDDDSKKESKINYKISKKKFKQQRKKRLLKIQQKDNGNKNDGNKNNDKLQQITKKPVSSIPVAPKPILSPPSQQSFNRNSSKKVFVFSELNNNKPNNYAPPPESSSDDSYQYQTQSQQTKGIFNQPPKPIFNFNQPPIPQQPLNQPQQPQQQQPQPANSIHSVHSIQSQKQQIANNPQLQPQPIIPPSPPPISHMRRALPRFDFDDDDDDDDNIQIDWDTSSSYEKYKQNRNVNGFQALKHRPPKPPSPTQYRNQYHRNNKYNNPHRHYQPKSQYNNQHGPPSDLFDNGQSHDEYLSFHQQTKQKWLENLKKQVKPEKNKKNLFLLPILIGFDHEIGTKIGENDYGFHNNSTAALSDFRGRDGGNYYGADFPIPHKEKKELIQKTSVSILMELVDAKKLEASFTYHLKECRWYLNGEIFATGQGKKKADARKQCAQHAIDRITQEYQYKVLSTAIKRIKNGIKSVASKNEDFSGYEVEVCLPHFPRRHNSRNQYEYIYVLVNVNPCISLKNFNNNGYHLIKYRDRCIYNLGEYENVSVEAKYAEYWKEFEGHVRNMPICRHPYLSRKGRFIKQFTDNNEKMLWKQIWDAYCTNNKRKYVNEFKDNGMNSIEMDYKQNNNNYSNNYHQNRNYQNNNNNYYNRNNYSNNHNNNYHNRKNNEKCVACEQFVPTTKSRNFGLLVCDDCFKQQQV